MHGYVTVGSEAQSLQNHHKLLKFVIRSGDNPYSHPEFPCAHVKARINREEKKV